MVTGYIQHSLDQIRPVESPSELAILAMHVDPADALPGYGHGLSSLEKHDWRRRRFLEAAWVLLKRGQRPLVDQGGGLGEALAN